MAFSAHLNYCPTVCLSVCQGRRVISSSSLGALSQTTSKVQSRFRNTKWTILFLLRSPRQLQSRQRLLDSLQNLRIVRRLNLSRHLALALTAPPMATSFARRAERRTTRIDIVAGVAEVMWHGRGAKCVTGVAVGVFILLGPKGGKKVS